MSFGCQTHYQNIVKILSTLISCYHVSPKVPKSYLIVEHLTKLDWSPLRLFVMSTIGFSQALWFLNSQSKIYQSLTLHNFSLSLESSIVKPLSKGQLKVELHFSLACTSCLQLVKSWPKFSQSAPYHFI